MNERQQQAVLIAGLAEAQRQRLAAHASDEAELQQHLAIQADQLVAATAEIRAIRGSRGWRALEAWGRMKRLLRRVASHP